MEDDENTNKMQYYINYDYVNYVIDNQNQSCLNRLGQCSIFQRVLNSFKILQIRFFLNSLVPLLFPMKFNKQRGTFKMYTYMYIFKKRILNKESCD